MADGPKGYVRDLFRDTRFIVADKAEIGRDVSIGVGTVVHKNVVIGDGTCIGPNVVIGEPLPDAYGPADYENPPTLIGHESIIRSGTVVYAGCTLGKGLATGHNAIIRENTVCGEKCSFGTFSTSDGDVNIGDRCRFHYYTHICKTAEIRNDVWMFPRSMLLSDMHPPCGRCVEGPRLLDRAVIGSAATISPKVKIGEDAVVAAASMVTKDVPEGMLVMGVPAKPVCKVSEIRCKEGILEHPYPWKDHYGKK